MQSLRGWQRPKLILLFTALTLPALLILRGTPGGAPRPFWLIGASLLGFGIAVCYGLPWLDARSRCRIWITEAAVSRGSWIGFVHVRRDQILSHHLEFRIFNGAPCRVLVLRRRVGGEAILGIAPDVDIDRLAEALQQVSSP